MLALRLRRFVNQNVWILIFEILNLLKILENFIASFYLINNYLKSIFYFIIIIIINYVFFLLSTTKIFYRSIQEDFY